MELTEADNKYLRLLVLAEFETVISKVLIKNEKLVDSDEKTIERNFCSRLREEIQIRHKNIIESN